MSNNQLIKKATLTASVVGIIGLSSFVSVEASHAAIFQVPVPVNGFNLSGDAEIKQANDPTFGGFFTTDYIQFHTQGTAISVNSPFINPSQVKSVFAHFDYAFTGTETEGLQFSLWNATNNTTAFSQFLAISTGESVSIDLTNFYTTPGFYQFAYNFSEVGAKAGFNNLVLKIEAVSVPEPTTTLALLALGIGAATLKRKGKISLGVLSKSAS
ncbi:PEP-CTERM sorting domain-containing protein [Nodularia sp. NIES-3585]|uniref:PEP-CTERM sorting domain-containing protein n=1 Tax=Nodularia sp. NIES-3585 TaxID=1973477 RepID=UPI000B5C2968|nr:PEP-CTERM sorting domain-containing protein [Nodularia sp. NIES-3585]GAX37234.1 hypothetical protein NIES3585_32760 [Nodularia sp. NIES-3585]